MCKDQILKKAGFDSHHILSHKDFEYLCFLIEEKSGIILSVSTLRRIWRNEYDRIPQDSTLDALAQLIEYESWNAFKMKAIKESASYSGSKTKTILPGKLKSKPLFFSVALLSIIMLVVIPIIFLSRKNNTGTLNTDTVIFRSYGTIMSGVPNTVVFEYNVDDVEADSFFIQQSWDKSRRSRIYKNNYFHTELYYYPDYHVAKLIANDKVIKEHDLYLNTDGWLPYVTYGNFNDKPIYLKTESLTENNSLSVSLMDLQNNEIDLAKNWVVHFRNTGAFKRIDSDNYTFRIRIRTKKGPFRSCPFFFVMINCRDASFEFPLVKKGCENTVWIKYSDFVLEGKQSDLSMSGCNLEIWQELVLENTDKNITVFLNDKKIYQHSYNRPGGIIAGFDLFSNSLFEIDYVLLYDKENQLVFEDYFEHTR